VFNKVDPPTTANTGLYRQLGTRRVESLLRAGGTVLVVAECSDASGSLQLQAPEGRGLFVLRRGTEDDFSRAIRRWRHIWTWSTWGLSAATVLAVVWIVR
jgi:siroheme synthase (precorrin-2 oxidase/ferrochelatase)